MQMDRILVTDDVHPILLKGLEEMGYACEYQPDISLAETTAIVSDYQGIVINSKIKADKAFLQKADQLRFVARLGSGLDIIDLEITSDQGIAVLSAPEGNANAVAEHAVAMLLCLFNNILSADAEVRDFDWDREGNRGVELAGKKVGIIGFGHTGPALAAKLSGFDVDILVHDPYRENFDNALCPITPCDLSQIQQEADIISMNVSLNPTSKNFVDRQFINRCQKPFYLINTSRGNVVKTSDLLQSLEAGKVLGACLDVFENEKTATFTNDEREMYGRLYQKKNVVLTPHVAGWTVESKRKIAEVLLEKIALLKN